MVKRVKTYMTKRTIFLIIAIILCGMLVFGYFFVQEILGKLAPDSERGLCRANHHSWWSPSLIELQNQNAEATFKIIKQDWTGWSEKQPEPEEFIISFNSKEGAEMIKEKLKPLRLEIFGKENDLRIIKIYGNAVLVQTDGLVNAFGGGYSLNEETKARDFTIYLNDSLCLATPTMDAGTSYTISLEEIR